MGCNCSKKVAGYVVKRPGQDARTVSTSSAAQALVKGVPGATVTPQGASK